MGHLCGTEPPTSAAHSQKKKKKMGSERVRTLWRRCAPAAPGRAGGWKEGAAGEEDGAEGWVSPPLHDSVECEGVVAGALDSVAGGGTLKHDTCVSVSVSPIKLVPKNAGMHSPPRYAQCGQGYRRTPFVSSRAGGCHSGGAWHVCEWSGVLAGAEAVAVHLSRRVLTQSRVAVPPRTQPTKAAHQ